MTNYPKHKEGRNLPEIRERTETTERAARMQSNPSTLHKNKSRIAVETNPRENNKLLGRDLQKIKSGNKTADGRRLFIRIVTRTKIRNTTEVRQQSMKTDSDERRRAPILPITTSYIKINTDCDKL
ncbi:hypothetical protein T08_13119 [Trichinella sp. T8]|nr:hypothetical protein T08_13119 [Trichinella sp. T8]